MVGRRRALAILGAAALAGGRARGEGEAPAFLAPLPIPPLLDLRAEGGRAELVARHGSHRFAPGMAAVGTMGYSADYLGPLLRVHRGEPFRITVTNRLDVPTTVHWHGLLVPSPLDGGPHHSIAPGAGWEGELLVDQPAATAIYHAHPHGDTARQVYRGLAGMLLVEDGAAAALGLPCRYGIDDLPVVLQDRLFNVAGGMSYLDSGPARAIGMRGNTSVVNGAIRPVARVPAGLVRLRLLNGANARTFDVAFDDGRPFHVIAGDGGLLARPVAMTRLLLAPGERFEIVADFGDGRPAVLATDRDPAGDVVGMGGPRGRPGVPSLAGPLLRLEPDPGLARDPAARLPATLVPLAAADPAAAAGRRRVSLDMIHNPDGMQGTGPVMAINGQVFDMHRIDFMPGLGTAEIWTLTGNRIPHPFHIHGAMFRILSIDGAPPPPHLAGDKDTVLVARPTEILVRFTQPAVRRYPFVFHCHLLEHEQFGMMAQYVTA